MFNTRTFWLNTHESDNNNNTDIVTLFEDYTLQPFTHQSQMQHFRSATEQQKKIHCSIQSLNVSEHASLPSL